MDARTREIMCVRVCVCVNVSIAVGLLAPEGQQLNCPSLAPLRCTLLHPQQSAVQRGKQRLKQLSLSK